MSKLHELAQLGQAIWLDDIRRDYFTSGELQRLVDLGLRGLTSNPTIFEKAIVGSSDYDALLQAHAGQSTEAAYYAIAIHEISAAADVLRPVYDATDGEDGFVSLEVSPTLARRTDETIEEATRLFAAVNRPNLMIKIPATTEGIPAIQAVLGRGINVNVTLIFSLTQYEDVMRAYMAGLEDYAACGGNLSRMASVASFFVSRVDTMVDKQLQALIEAQPATAHAQAARELLGKIACANARLAYGHFQETLAGERWQKLSALGARPQRPLWASTGVKNPAYPDTMYVDGLIGPHTVNTLPLETLRAALDHATVERSIDRQQGDARRQVMRLAELGISLEAVTRQLQADGVAAFIKSYLSLIQNIEHKLAALKPATEAAMGAAEAPAYSVQARLHGFGPAVDQALAELRRQRIVERIWAFDHQVWKDDPTEISNRLGWLNLMTWMQPKIAEMEQLTQAVQQAGYTHALLLGMGGSSLAPEVLRKTFGVKKGFLDVQVLDSTDPAMLLRYTRRLDPARTLFIVSTKSGGTVETFSFFRYFYNWVAASLGSRQAGEHFVAITDPGSKLAEVAEQHHFRATLINDPNIGGRYSALSFFGLAPAALMGIDVGSLLERAQNMATLCQQPAGSDNPAAHLGAILSELAKAGRNKMTLVTSPAICSFGDWVEQLVAESTGKDGQGIVPVVGGSVADPEIYSSDRLFIYLRLDGDHTYDAQLMMLEGTGQPVVELTLHDLHDLGAQFFLWELATAIAGQRLGIQPFDQPDVEAAKIEARRVVAAYQSQGALPESVPTLKEDDILVYGSVQAGSLGEVWRRFLNGMQPGNYLAIQAYIPPGEDTDASLLALRNRLRQLTHMAVTTGYGPRFLHSTGQLHKGDSGQGRFIQITATPPQDIAIPDEIGSHASAMSFGVLELAQSLGDRQALENAGRSVLRFHIDGDVLVGLARLAVALD